MNSQQKLFTRIFLYTLLAHPALTLATENTAEETTEHADDTRRSFLKQFTSVNVSDTLTTNALRVTNGGNITGGLTVLGSLIANGAVITPGAVGPQGPAGVSQYAFVSSTGAQTVTANNPVIFTYTTAAPSSAGITVPATGQSIFTVASTGTYMILYLLVGTTGLTNNEIQLKIVGGAAIPNSTFNKHTNSDLPMTAFTIASLTAGQQFQFVNSSLATVTVPDLGVGVINAAVLILQLA